ncbi:MAG: adenosine deaminase [Fusobacteriota bacterium]
MDIDKLRNMKKAEIHIHLDGSVRIATILDLAKKNEIKLPADNKVNLKKYLQVNEKDKSLVDYLKKFQLPIKVMQTKENIERISFELLEDLANRNYIYVEVRFSPVLHMEKGLSLDEVVESVLKGMEKAKNEYGIEYGLILSVMRHMDRKTGMEILNLARDFKYRGVVGIDLAGDEENYPVDIFEKLFRVAKQYNIKYTIHAGEADGFKSVEKALDIGADRIGHGIRAFEDENLLERIKDENITLEICPISNYQTGVLKDFKDYPIMDFLEKGIRVSLNTDNQTVSNTNLIKEVEFLEKYFKISFEDVKKMVRNSILGSFTSKNTKRKLLEKL